MTPTRKKIASPRKLNQVLAQLRKKEKRIVFTNGCFDLLHRGHVTYLEAARKLGDVLVVALNSDESTRRLKGEGRPINPLEDRQAVIAALACVDYVTAFGEDTPRELILMLKPDVLTKGGDYEASKIVGSSEVRSWGGKVKILPFLPGRSTTGMLARGGG